jgi:Zn-dependent peptidase ImmA (M78 family)
MSVRWRRIQTLTSKLLVDNRIVDPPVPVERIATSLGIEVIQQKYEEDTISGFLYRSPNHSIIGVNTNNANTRIRFTIAHEIGHFLLHDYELGNVHLDYAFQVKLRDDESSQGTNTEEIEANAFAADLLMPSRFLIADLAPISTLDIEDDRFLKKFADRYQVSMLAMHIRLAHLGYIIL